MRAAILHECPGELTMTDALELGEPHDDEVVVKIDAIGMCHSDVHVMDGVMPAACPAVLGHEAAGTVERAGAAAGDFSEGDRVVITLSVHCGHCKMCRTGYPSVCINKPALGRGFDDPAYTLDGQGVVAPLRVAAFTEKAIVHHSGLVKIPDGFSTEQASLIGCAVPTGMGAVMRTAEVKPGDSCVVIGAGGVGLSSVQGARIAGAGQIIVVDRNPAALELATKVGATHAVTAGNDIADAVGEVNEITQGGADHVFEAIGLPVLTQAGFQMLGRRGQLVIIGLHPHDQNFSVPGLNFVGTEAIVRGSNMGSQRPQIDLPIYMDYAQRGLLDLDAVVTDTMPWEDMGAAIDRLREGAVGRTVVTF